MKSINELLAEALTDRTTEICADPATDEVTKVSLLQGCVMVTLLAELLDLAHEAREARLAFEQEVYGAAPPASSFDGVCGECPFADCGSVACPFTPAPPSTDGEGQAN